MDELCPLPPGSTMYPAAFKAISPSIPEAASPSSHDVASPSVHKAVSAHEVASKPWPASALRPLLPASLRPAGPAAPAAPAFPASPAAQAVINKLIKNIRFKTVLTPTIESSLDLREVPASYLGIMNALWQARSLSWLIWFLFSCMHYYYYRSHRRRKPGEKWQDHTKQADSARPVRIINLTVNQLCYECPCGLWGYSPFEGKHIGIVSFNSFFSFHYSGRSSTLLAERLLPPRVHDFQHETSCGATKKDSKASG